MRILNINNEIKYFYPSFRAYERTFILIKPDAFERGLDSTIMDKLKESDLKVSMQWEGIPKREKVEGVYNSYKQKNFFHEWMDYLTKGKIRALIAEGEDAVDKVLAIKKQIRNEYAPMEKRYNLMHSSDTVPDAQRESNIFFCVA